jgi:DNA gyrase subunit A
MFFTDKYQVYKTRLSEFDDTKASVLGDYLPAKLGMDPDENVIYAVLPGDYSGGLLFFFENGKVARVGMDAYQTASNRRKLTGAYSDKSPLVAVRRVDEDGELAIYSSEPRVLIFHTALLSPKATRATQGVQVMNLKKNRRVEKVLAPAETPIVNSDRYRMRSIPAAGALLKEEDAEEQQLEIGTLQ